MRAWQARKPRRGSYITIAFRHLSRFRDGQVPTSAAMPSNSSTNDLPREASGSEETHTFERRIYPIMNADGTVDRAVEIIKDVTEEVRLHLPCALASGSCGRG